MPAMAVYDSLSLGFEDEFETRTLDFEVSLFQALFKPVYALLLTSYCLSSNSEGYMFASHHGPAFLENDASYLKTIFEARVKKDEFGFSFLSLSAFNV